MSRFSVFLPFALLLWAGTASTAPLSASDRIRQGLAAFNAEDYEKAEELLRPIEKTQPSAQYLLRWVDVMKKKKGYAGDEKKKIAADVLEKSNAKLNKLGMIIRATSDGRTSGLAAEMEKRSLLASAGKKNTAAAYKLGLFFQEGIAFPRNFAASAKYFKIAANNGNAAAMNTLGLYHRFGLGVETNAGKARDFYEKAILKKDTYALYNLADMLNGGDGVGRDVLQAHLLADMAVFKMKSQKKKERKKIIAAEYLKKTTGERLTPLQSAYLQKFVPDKFAPAMSKAFLNGRKHPALLPLPPVNGLPVQDTTFMSRLNTDPDAYKFKKIPPLMPDWVSFDATAESNAELDGKKPPFPFAGTPDALSALYYRQAVPQRIFLTLDKRETALPLMAGDIISLYVYSPLHETEATMKGAHKTMKNTAYEMSFTPVAGVIATDGVLSVKPLSAETEKNEGWIGTSFLAVSAGKAVVRFKSRFEENPAFEHTVVFQVFPAPEL